MSLAKFDEEFLQNPTKYGFCTFSEFQKNPDKWRPQKDMLLHSVDNGATSDTLKDKIRGYRYFLEGYRCETIEEVERQARSMGIDHHDLVVGVIVRDKTDNGKEILHVHFMSKETVEKRKTW
jgi:hypothetical protein